MSLNLQRFIKTFWGVNILIIVAALAAFNVYYNWQKGFVELIEYAYEIRPAQADTYSFPTPLYEIFVSPNGSPDADGTIENPRTLKNVIGDWTVAAGTTIWLRGGNYEDNVDHDFRQHPDQNGTLIDPIIYRPYNHERTTILDRMSPRGNSTYWVGLELTSLNAFGGFSINDGDDVRLINNIIHDLPNGWCGIWGGNCGLDHIYYGNVIYGIATQTLIEDCETAWNEYVGTGVTSTADGAVKMVGDFSAKATCDVTTGQELIITEARSEPIRDTYQNGFYARIRSTVDMDAGDWHLYLDNNASCVSPEVVVALPAMTANTWYDAFFSASSIVSGSFAACTEIISVGLYQNVVKGPMEFYIDDVRYRPGGHCIYAQNTYDNSEREADHIHGIKKIHMNILGPAGKKSLQVASIGGNISGFDIRYNIAFKCGSSFLVGCSNSKVTSKIWVIENYLYGGEGYNHSYAESGWGGPCREFTFSDNYVVASYDAAYFRAWCSNNTVTGNTFMPRWAGNNFTLYTWEDKAPETTGVWDENEFYVRAGSAPPYDIPMIRYPAGPQNSWAIPDWTAYTGLEQNSIVHNTIIPSTNKIVVLPNAYEYGRGHIAIYNWESSSNVSVNLSSVLTSGDNFRIVNVENYYGTPVSTGKYSGGSVSIPMNSEEFKVFVVMIDHSATTEECTENDWSYSDGECQSNNTLTRTWTQTNEECSGGVTHPSTETISCTYTPPACAEANWTSSDSACQLNNTLTRTWTKIGNCAGGITHNATETIDCTYGCTPSWQCSNWSSCVNSIQTRTCSDSNDCGTTTDRPALSQSCSSSDDDDDDDDGGATTTTNRPAAPRYLETTVSGNTATLSWRKALYADSYTLYLNKKLIKSNIPTNQYVLTNLDRDRYSWYVISVNSAGKTQSSNGSFTIDISSDNGTTDDPIPIANTSLVRTATISTVYLLNQETNTRSVFPNPTTYFSWYNDFSNIATVSITDLAKYLLKSNVCVRSTKLSNILVKIQTNPNVYEVKENCVLSLIETEELAIERYGANWAKKVVDIPDVFFVDYVVE